MGPGEAAEIASVIMNSIQTIALAYLAAAYRSP